MHHYRVYGLDVASELPMPELRPGGGRPPDVQVAFGPVRMPPAPANGNGDRPERAGDPAYMGAEGLARIAVYRGERILLDPEPQADEAQLRDLLLGPVFVMLLHQRERLVLHASCAALGEKAVAFLGGSGRGKSTTLKALWDRGHTALSDDVTVVGRSDGIPTVWAGPSRLYLWPEGVRPGASPGPGQPPPPPPGGKRIVRTDGAGAAEECPLRRIYVLRDAPVLEIEPLPAAQACVELVRHSYPSAMHWLGPTGSHSSNLRQCVELAGRVGVSVLKRPQRLSMLPALVDRIEADAADEKRPGGFRRIGARGA